MNFVLKFVYWIFLNIMIGLTMDFALFTQTTSDMKDAHILVKITFLSAPQISLSSYIFDFLAQLWSNTYWLKLPTTIDDYVGMCLIFFGMYAAKYTIFG